ncbi:MAG TPA: hypothetical protein VF718_05800 [Allosphingosinicella sp.]|jgi:hypothetical protein
MAEIDRRSLMTLAGAGLLMAGTARAQCPVVEEESGGCPPHGQLATATGPLSETPVTFDPEHICVVYVRFSEDRTLKVRTAYVAPAKPYNLAAVVKPILDDMRNNNNFNAKRKEEDLENFTFGGQQRIVLFIDNDPKNIGFDDRFGLENIVRFTQYRGSNPALEAKKNNAFFNLKRLDFATLGPLKSRTAYELEFWNTDDEGNPIEAIKECPTTHYIYSMNIHLKMAVKTSGEQAIWIPIILDPDTGNMGGDP